MKLSVIAVLRFLFPEIQILDTIAEEGFIAIKSKAKSNANRTNSTAAGNTVLQNSGRQSTQSPVVFTGRANGSTAGAASSTIAVSADKVDNSFGGIEQQLRERWIASNSNIRALCQAFKRPFVTGANSVMPKNVILLIGNESRGKVKAIGDMCALLKQRRILRYEEVPSIGFERYPTGSED